jgi:hypothetical protein
VRDVPDYERQVLFEQEQERMAAQARREALLAEHRRIAGQAAPESAAAVAAAGAASEASPAQPAGEDPAVPKKQPSTISNTPLSAPQSRQWKRIREIEASTQGALRGDLGDLKTAFAASGIFPPRGKRRR